MTYLPCVKTLRPIACAVALGAVTGTLAGPVSAKAQIQTYYHAGAWDAFSGRDERGGAVCGIGNTNPSDNRRTSIRFVIGGTETMLRASKPDWSIPDNTQVRVVMQIGLNTPWTRPATGHAHDIDWTLDPAAMQAFDRQFRAASSMTLTFPDGNEPPWTIPLAGSTAISDAFGRCIRDLTRQVQAATPVPNGAPPPQGPTQPFSPQADTQQGGPQQDGMQQDDRQRNDMQHDGMQQDGAQQDGQGPTQPMGGPPAR